MSISKEKIVETKGISIWSLVAFLYTPILLCVLLINLPKVELKYVFESNKTKLARHYEKAKTMVILEFLIMQIVEQVK